jgi:hypothetical protein
MSEIGSILLTGVGLILLWLVIYYGWRPYRIDKVRNDLFALRDELFLFAANGGVSFNDPAYRCMRDRLNALIRYAHIITLSRAMLHYFAEQFVPSVYTSGLHKEWLLSLARIPETAREKIKKINDRMAIVLAWQVITGSPFLLLVLTIYVPLRLFIRWLRRDPYESTRLSVAKELRVELIEEQALLAQTQEREMATCVG